MPVTPEQRKANMAKAREKLAANRAARKAQNPSDVAAQDAYRDIEAAKQMEQLVEAIDHEREQVRGNRARTPIRAQRDGGRVQVTGRNGEVLSRQRTQTGDIYEIPRELIPQGWDYQWCAVSVVGNTEILMDQNLMMAENGWRPVPAERHPGRFMPVGHKGSIVRGGQMLMERPMALSEEARAEDIRAAHRLISDRNESLKLGSVKKEMAQGFEMSNKYRGTGGSIKMDIDRGLDIPRPSYDLADPD